MGATTTYLHTKDHKLYLLPNRLMKHRESRKATRCDESQHKVMQQQHNTMPCTAMMLHQTACDEVTPSRFQPCNAAVASPPLVSRCVSRDPEPRQLRRLREAHSAVPGPVRVDREPRAEAQGGRPCARGSNAPLAVSPCVRGGGERVDPVNGAIVADPYGLPALLRFCALLVKRLQLHLGRRRGPLRQTSIFSSLASSCRASAMVLAAASEARRSRSVDAA